MLWEHKLQAAKKLVGVMVYWEGDFFVFVYILFLFILLH